MKMPEHIAPDIAPFVYNPCACPCRPSLPPSLPPPQMDNNQLIPNTPAFLLFEEMMTLFPGGLIAPYKILVVVNESVPPPAIAATAGHGGGAGVVVEARTPNDAVSSAIMSDYTFDTLHRLSARFHSPLSVHSPVHLRPSRRGLGHNTDKQQQGMMSQGTPRTDGLKRRQEALGRDHTTLSSPSRAHIAGGRRPNDIPWRREETTACLCAARAGRERGVQDSDGPLGLTLVLCHRIMTHAH